jgi:hypothetical protein
MTFGGQDRGLYSDTVNTLSISSGGSEVARADTGGLKVIDGTASVPSYSFIGDTNTGIYSAGANELAITTNGTLAVSVNASQQLNLHTHKIINVVDPTDPQDVATKFYVDAISAGLDPKASSRVATTTALPAVTAAGSGVGKTLTANAVGVLTVDGVATVLNDRILVKNQATASDNGIYKVTTEGTAGVAFVLTRATDQDGSPANEVSGGNFTFVEQGTVNVGTGWVVVWDGDIVVDTNAINWTQFSETGTVTYVGGAGITQSGSTTVTFDVVANDTSITVNANDLLVHLNTTGGLETSTGVRIKSDTVTANTIAITTTSNGAGVKYDANSFSESSEALTLASGVAGDGLALTSGVLSVNVDGSTLQITTDTLSVKNAGITATQLASLSVTFAKTKQIIREVPAGSINSSNVTFTPANAYTNGSECVFLNGILQNAGGNDYTGNGTTIVFGIAPTTGDVLLVNYWY